MIHFVIFWFCSYKNYDFFLPYYQLPPNAEGSAEPCEAIGASLRTQVKTFKSCNLCPDSSLSGNSIYSITIKLPFYDRSRMTGRYLLPFCKKLFYLSAPTCLFRQAGMAFLPESFSYFCFYSYFFLFARKKTSALVWRGLYFISFIFCLCVLLCRPGVWRHEFPNGGSIFSFL